MFFSNWKLRRARCQLGCGQAFTPCLGLTLCWQALKLEEVLRQF